MISHAIELARESRLFDDIIVSTDDRETEEIAERYGANIFRRPYDDGSRGTQEVTAEVLREMKTVRYACCLYPCSPLVVVADLLQAQRMVVSYAHLYAMGVGAQPLRDAGAFYLGQAFAFVENDPLIGPWTSLIRLPESRVVDINTQEDWDLAEMLYASLRDNK
jgi:N-acylneuraminate cytidylyltransferase